MKRALVTGAAGFVGRHMVRELLARGWDVRSVDLESMEVVIDFRGPAHLHVIDDALRLFRHGSHVFDLVVHCAYHVGGRAAIDGEPRMLARNLELDAAMFDWAVRTGQRRVLYFSSSAAYPVGFQTGSQPYRLHEDDADPDQPVSADLLAAMGGGAPLRPDANYGWAKLTGEQLARAAGEAGLAVHVVRPFSGYGSDQSLDYPFPSIIRRAREGDLTVWGPPGQTRDWIHISDVVSGALAVVAADERRPVNLCTGVGTEMGDLARLVAYAAGLDPGIEPTYLTDKPTGVMYRVGDPSRMHELYVPKVSLIDGVERALKQ